MNYWFAEMTNMDVTSSLFDYFEVCVCGNDMGILVTGTRRKIGLREALKPPRFSTIFRVAG